MIRREPGDVDSFEDDLPSARLQQSGDRLEGCCFSGAVGANDGDDFSLRDLERDVP